MGELDAASASRPRAARVVLGLGVILGLGYLAYSVTTTPGKAATDFEVYRAAAADLWAGRPVYGRSPVGVPGLTYRYPPLLLVWFSLYLLLSPLVGFALHVAGTLAVSVLLGVVLIRATERHGIELASLDRVLIVGFVAVSPVGAPSLLYGNVNHHVAAVMALGLVWLADGAESRAGVALALAALPKVFPAGIGVWLLWRRAWRAIATALVTGVGALVAGAAFFGLPLTADYVTAELLPRSAPETFVGGLPATSVFVTVRRPLSVVFPDAGSTAITVGSVLLLAPVVASVYRRSRGPIGRMVAVFTTTTAVLLVLPSYTMYFLVLSYPLVPLLYLLDGPVGDVFAVGTLLTMGTLKLRDVRLVVEWLGLPAPVEQGILIGARSVYTVGTPVLWGAVILLAACAWRAGGRHTREPDPPSADHGVDG